MRESSVFIAQSVPALMTFHARKLSKVASHKKGLMRHPCWRATPLCALEHSHTHLSLHGGLWATEAKWSQLHSSISWQVGSRTRARFSEALVWLSLSLRSMWREHDPGILWDLRSRAVLQQHVFKLALSHSHASETLAANRLLNKKPGWRFSSFKAKSRWEAAAEGRGRDSK